MAAKLRAGVFGASGYVGGELLRLLLGHPEVEVAAAISTSAPGRPVDGAHPNLRGLTRLLFCAPADMPPCDVLFFATPHKETFGLLPAHLGRATCLIDLSADFRLRDRSTYERYYEVRHGAPELLARFVYGLPELHRKELAEADLISVPGCMATAAIIGLAPLAAAGLVDSLVLVDGRIGSSGSGAKAQRSNAHAERSDAMRVFAPAGHRHEAEVAQETGLEASMTATGIPVVRGAQVVARAALNAQLGEADLRRLYRERYAGEPFVRLVTHRRGLYRLPEPKILLGSNFCDVGFALTADGRTVTVVSALDNLMKGAAGNAVQCLNVRMGWSERLGLEFAGLHPV